MDYPKTDTKVFKYEVCGKTLDDPYQWLENMKSEEVDDWVKAQNNHFLDWVREADGHDEDVDRLVKYLERHDTIPALRVFKGFIYNFHREKGHDYGFFRRIKIHDYVKDGKDASWEMLFDLDEYNKSMGENAKWTWHGSNPCEENPNRLMFNLSDSGKDASVFKEYDIEKKAFVEDGFFIPLEKSDLNWAEDASALYTTYPTADSEKSECGYSRVVRRLKRGENFNVPIIYQAEKSSMALSPRVHNSKKHSYLIVREFISFHESKYSVTVSGDGVRKDSFKEIPLTKKDELMTVHDDFLLYHKLEGDDKGAVFAVYLPEFLEKGSFAPQKLLDPVIIENWGWFHSKDSVFVMLLENALPKLIELKLDANGSNLTTKIIEHESPKGGIFKNVMCSKFEDDVFLLSEGYLLPGTMYYLENGNLKNVQGMDPIFDTEDLVFDRMEVEAKDGTRFPVDIVRKKDIKLNGENPCILYAYGGFNITVTPNYIVSLGVSWLERGGVYAVAHIRGGGDFGPEWHEAGRKEKRPIVFDDYIAAAETLIENKITNPKRLAIKGGSNGGLLVSATMVRKPELFNAVVCQVPLIDMVRYVFLPPGSSWVDEYGDPRQMPDYEWISEYSPYQNVKDGQEYPNILFKTSRADDRVHPGHARKMTALMQSKNMSSNTFLYETLQGGHSGSGKLKDMAEEQVVVFSFLRKVLV